MTQGPTTQGRSGMYQYRVGVGSFTKLKKILSKLQKFPESYPSLYDVLTLCANFHVFDGTDHRPCTRDFFLFFFFFFRVLVITNTDRLQHTA